jgi:hypothetical protein
MEDTARFPGASRGHWRPSNQTLSAKIHNTKVILNLEARPPGVREAAKIRGILFPKTKKIHFCG